MNYDFETNLDARLEAIAAADGQAGKRQNSDDINFLIACVRHWRAKSRRTAALLNDAIAIEIPNESVKLPRHFPTQS